MKISNSKPGGGLLCSSTKILQTLFQLLILTSITTCHVKLNVPRVRLPYLETLSVNFTLNVDTPGCYKWTVSRPNVIKLITPTGYNFEGTECSDLVVVSAIPRTSPCCPAHTIVYAEEINTKETVRCDVVVDRIASLSIVTTTKELHLEEAPSKFTIRGYGVQGSEFSTLEGVPFKWWFETTNTADQTSGGDSLNILRFIPFSESMYEAAPAIAELELKRLQGSQVLIEGLKTGSGNIFAKITDAYYKNIQPADVRTVVIANLVLDPNEIYVVPETVFPMQLLQLKQGKFVEIKLPSPVHIFEVSNTTVINYDKGKSFVTALGYGDSKIVVRDKNGLVDMLEDEQHPTANIFVREPRFLSITVSPYRNLALVIGKEYEFIIEMYDAENQKFYIGNQIFVKTEIDGNYLNVQQSSENGTHHVATPLKEGTTKITAQLDHTKSRDGKILPLKRGPRVQVEVDIFQPISVDPERSIWPCQLHRKHEIQLKASGGNGNFVWSSTNYSVVVSGQNGLARTDSCGYADITAAMTINPNIKAHAKIYILKPTSMKIIEQIVEGEVGTPILVPVALYTTLSDDNSGRLVAYTSCTSVPFSVEIEDSENFYYDPKLRFPHSSPACAYLPIVGNILGSTEAAVLYEYEGLSFADSVVISTFKPLQVVEPASFQTVLAVGSSRQVVFSGGPRPSMERSHEFRRNLVLQNKTVAEFNEFKPLFGTKDDVYVYEITCREIGETNVTLEVGNYRSNSGGSRPVLRKASVQVICGEPAQIQFKVDSDYRKAETLKCPLEYSSHVAPYPILNDENALVSVVVKDPKGRKFDNITSLVIEWSTTYPLVGFKYEEYITTSPIPMNGFHSVGKSLQTIVPKGESGVTKITALIKGYRSDIIKKLGLRDIQLAPETRSTQRQYSLELDLVSDVVVDPTDVTIFNHPSHQTVVRLRDGSGYFALNSTSSPSSKFMYFENNKTVLISPLNEGDERITVQDLCLRTRRAAEIIIRVNGVGTLELDAVDKIELGKSINATIKILGNTGRFLPIADLALIKIQPKFNEDILDVKQIDQLDSELLGIQFQITGKNLGQTSINFVADSVGRISRSVSKKMTVFPPLTISPENVTMLIDSVYQLIAQGGPQLDTVTNFTIDSSDIASVSTIGIVQGQSLGLATVQAKAMERTTPGTIYSTDFAYVNVVQFQGIRIYAPLTKIVRNHEMPMWAIESGSGLEPSVLLGTKAPLLKLKWQISNKETGEIYFEFQQRGGQQQPREDQLRVRFKGKQPGHVAIKLLAIYNGQTYADETEIEVLEDLRLSTSMGVSESHNFIMTPNSELNLRTNRDTSKKVVFTVESSQDFTCLEIGTNCAYGKNSHPTIVTVDSSGIVKSYDTFGIALILAHVREESGIVQTISAAIEVKPVRYIMISTKLPVNLNGEDGLIMPRGISWTLTVTYHDNVGRTFGATNLQVKARPSRLDLVQVNSMGQNSTFGVQSLAEGPISVQMSVVGNEALRDYTTFSIAEAIRPKLPTSEQILVGDVFCFSCSVKSSISDKHGYWNVHPADMMFIDPEIGIGVPIKSGLSRVEYVIDGAGVVTSTDVLTKGIPNLQLQSFRKAASLTNGDLNATFNVSVFLGNKTRNLYGQNCPSQYQLEEQIIPFSCELEYENKDVGSKIFETFSVRPVFDFNKGLYECRIEPVKIEKYLFYMSTINSAVLIRAKLKERATDKYHGAFESVGKLMFYPAVYVHTTELQLTNRDPHAKVIVTGLKEVLNQLIFIPSDPSFLSTGKAAVVKSPQIDLSDHRGDLIAHSTASNANAETREFKISLLQGFWSSDKLDQGLGMTISSVLTKQKILIPVKVKLTNVNNIVRTEGIWSLIDFFWQTGSQIFSAVLLVILTLTILHYASKYFISLSTNTLPPETESVFMSRPSGRQSSHTPLQQPRTSSSSSHSPSNMSGAGDAGYSSQRLYSTQDLGTGLYGSNAYLKKYK